MTVTGDWHVVRASRNTTTFLGVEHELVVSQPIEAHISAEVMHAIRGRLQMSAGATLAESLFRQQLAQGGPPYDIAIHKSGNELVLEFEPSGSETGVSLSTLRAMVPA